jgi:hypothetical protein
MTLKSSLGAPFSWLEKPRNHMGQDLDCMADVLMGFHQSTFSKLNSLTHSLTHSLSLSLTPWYRILFEKLSVTQLIKKYPDFFMEPEGSSLCSQKPATEPYPEPAKSSFPH